MLKHALATLFIISLAGNGWAQQAGEPADSLSEDVERESEPEDETEKRHSLAISVGYTHIPDGADDIDSETGVFVPTLGLDYFYRLNPKWEVGVIVDIEFGEYLIIDEDLNRKNAIIVAAMVGYEIMPSWAVKVGGGIEFEEHENLAVLRLLTEYQFPLENDFFLSPGVLADIKKDFIAWGAFVIGGKRF